MVLDITTRCKMGCKHCLNRCEEAGVDMTLGTFKRIADFLHDNKLRFRVVLIGGGEPTEHPQFFDVLDWVFERLSTNAYGDKTLFMLATNGTFVNRTDAKEFIDRLLGYGLKIQITADPRFYDIELDKTMLDYVLKSGDATVETNVRLLAQMGRALDHPMPEMPSRMSPFCFNARSMSRRNGYDFTTILHNFENLMYKWCSVCIDPLGAIRIAESLECPTIGTVFNSMQEIDRTLKEFDCTACVHAKRLDPAMKAAIEMR
jgi:organic radical activating enzyme